MYSNKYHQMLNLHKDAHENGLIRITGIGRKVVPPEKVFEGSELVYVLPQIKNVKTLLGLNTFLDYGCGKGNAYKLPFVCDVERWNHVPHYLDLPVINFTLFDPCVDEFSERPPKGKKFDCVICTDVLEHIPFEDIHTVLHELFGHARKLVVLSIACNRSYAHFEDGKVNAHCNVQTVRFWQETLGAFSKHYGIQFYARITSNGKTTHAAGGNPKFSAALGVFSD